MCDSTPWLKCGVTAVLIFMAGGACTYYHIPNSRMPQETDVPIILFPHSCRAMSFSPDGRKLACAVNDGTIRIHDVPAGTTVMTLKAYEGNLEETINLINPKTGMKFVHYLGVRKMSYSNDGKLLACISDDSALRIWETATGREIHKIPITPQSCYLSWSPESGRLATADVDGAVTLWDAISGQQLSSFSAESVAPRRQEWVAPLGAILFTHDGQLITGREERCVRLWDVFSGQQIRSIPLPQGFLQMALCCDGKKLAVVDKISASALIPIVRESAYLIDLDTMTRQYLHVSALGLTPFAVSPDGSKLAFTFAFYRGRSKPWELSIRVYSVDQGEIIGTFSTEDGVAELAFSPDSRLFVASGERLRIWRLSQ